MTDEQRAKLAEKKKHVAMKMQAQQVISYYIKHHWLDYYETMLRLGMQADIVHFHTVSEEELPYYKNVIKEIDHPLLTPELITMEKISPMDEFFDAFPTIDNFKYIVDLPVISKYGGDPREMITLACNQLELTSGTVNFMSNDVLPVLQLQLNELIENATELFDDGGIVTLIFTDPDKKWIIFRSIEEEWRCGFWPGDRKVEGKGQKAKG